jgi:hypothetical protein
MFLPTRPNMSIGHCLRTLAWVLPTLAPHLLTAQVTYTFSNTTVAAHDSWNSGNDWSTALVREVVVSGVPTSGMVLRQVNLDLGSAAGSNISTLAARLTDPSGNIIPLFNAGYFYNTDFSRYVNIHLRDHVFLKRLNDYTNSYLGMPYSFGYYRVETPGSFANLNTTTSVNGTWTFSMIENTGTEIQFNSVELVFGPPFTYVDISDNSNNSACAQSQCLQSGASEIVLATNVGYPHNQPAYPGLTVGGCNWNAEANNTAWFHFTATASTVQVSVSGFDNDPQQTIVLHNNGTCAAPSYSVVGCPTSMFVGGCNTTTGHPTLYHRVCYDGGTKFNHGYTLTGLTSGQQYVLVVDGQAGVSSTFYIELTTGADNTCMSAGPVIDDVAPTAPGEASRSPPAGPVWSTASTVAPPSSPTRPSPTWVQACTISWCATRTELRQRPRSPWTRPKFQRSQVLAPRPPTVAWTMEASRYRPPAPVFNTATTAASTSSPTPSSPTLPPALTSWWW